MPVEGLGQLEAVCFRLITLHLHLSSMQKDVMHQAALNGSFSMQEYAPAFNHLQTIHIDKLVNTLLMLFDILNEFILSPDPTAGTDSPFIPRGVTEILEGLLEPFDGLRLLPKKFCKMCCEFLVL